MISLTLSVCLSVCLYLSTYYYLSVCRFYLDLSVSVCSVNSNSSRIELRYEHFCRQLSPLVSLPFFPSRSLSFTFSSSVSFSLVISLFSLFLSFSFPFSLSPSTSSHFALKTVTSLDRRDDNLFTLASVLVDLTFTQLLFSR